MRQIANVLLEENLINESALGRMSSFKLPCASSALAEQVQYLQAVVSLMALLMWPAVCVFACVCVPVAEYIEFYCVIFLCYYYIIIFFVKEKHLLVFRWRLPQIRHICMYLKACFRSDWLHCLSYCQCFAVVTKLQKHFFKKFGSNVFVCQLCQCLYTRCVRLAYLCVIRCPCYQ